MQLYWFVLAWGFAISSDESAEYDIDRVYVLSNKHSLDLCSGHSWQAFLVLEVELAQKMKYWWDSRMKGLDLAHMYYISKYVAFQATR